MGAPMARNLASAGHEVRAWNRTASKAEGLGATVAASPVEAVEGAEVIITMLADGPTVAAVMDDVTLADDVIWWQASTVGVEWVTKFAPHVDGPVMGTRQPAEEGKLVVLESGPEEARPRLVPVFDAIGQRTIRVGEAGAGSRLKVVVNCWVIGVVEAAAETIALAEGLDLDPDLFFTAVEGGTLDLPYLRIKGKAMIERDFTPSFRLALAAKDAALARRAAEERDLDLPLIEAIARRFAEVAKEHGDEDISATYLASTPRRT